ncbi:unnamed protein product [Orchesella dallaii]|uniref:Serpin domain-containing protein n=1 Tax=Orchesella dallaii TaxID=48710 RepID=A0ABP1PLH7_9HEXA
MHNAYRTDSQRPRAPKVTEEDPLVLNMKRVLLSANKFSTRFYSVMNEYTPEDSAESIEANPSSEDLVYSPITIFTSLVTLRNGAYRDTANELSTALSISKLNSTILYTGMRLLLQSIQHRTEEGSLNLINRLFLDHSFHPDESFVNSVHDDFHGELVQTHFSNASAATSFVNSNMHVSSHGVLENVITHTEDNSTEELNTTLTVIDGGLMLVSGFTLEAEWERGFTPLLTRNESFTREDGYSTRIPMMHRDGSYFYGEIPELNASALSIPYKGGRFSLNVILPAEDISVAEVEQNLESFPFPAVLSRLKRQYVQVSLPRFQIHDTIDLISPLEGIGITKCFSENHADLSNMVEDVGIGELYLTNAVHKTFIDVSEGGSRVPSANFIEAVPAQARLLTPFTVNRPFVFFVYDQLLQTTVVVGRKAL